ncbi:MAG TPA: 2TM domain-containing protein, partial [Spirochaetia bacterium]|nr:2TM domain-containing protein [Spirochaetia bacterium]
DAVKCSLAIQEAVAAGRSRGDDRQYGLTMGVHLGDIHFLENDAAGEAISIASKLQTMARPGSVAISQEVYNSISGKLTVPVRSCGQVSLEGRNTAIQAYEVRSAGSPSTAESPYSEPTPSKVEDFDELKVFVLDQIKRVGRRLSTEKVRAMLQSRSPELDDAIEKLADMGFLSRGSSGASTSSAAPIPPTYSPGRGGFDRYDREAWREARHAIRHAVHEGRHDYHHARNSDNSELEVGLPRRTYPEYRQRVIERAHKAAGGFAGHLIPFLVVNGFLFFLNLSTGFGFPWFLFPLGGWAIGLISHFVSVNTQRREKKEVEALPETLGDEDYRLLRGFHKARASMRSTLASLASVGGFLLMVNLITSPSFIWAAFPIAGLLIAAISSITTYASKRGSFRKRLKELFARKGAAGGAEGPLSETRVEDVPIVREAVRIASNIIDQSKRLDPTKAYLGEDLEPLLENYIGQIRTLTRRGGEVEEIMAAIPRAELKRDLAALQLSLEKATDLSLKKEYQKSIEQIERQNRSFEELENQKELLDLRISGSLNSLKQMQIDLARMTGLSAEMEIASIDRLRDRSKELTDYLTDFNDGYREIEELPQSGEAQRLRADQLLKEFKEREKGSDNR